jgi:hypothetical protein
MNEQMKRLRTLLGSARVGNLESVAIIRNIMRKSVESAPADAIVDLAQHLYDNRLAELKSEAQAN